MVQDGSRILVQDGSRILREMGREMAPRNFDSPPRNRPRNDSAKSCTALREIFTALREICPRNFFEAIIKRNSSNSEPPPRNFRDKFLKKIRKRCSAKSGKIWWKLVAAFVAIWRILAEISKHYSGDISGFRIVHPMNFGF